MSDMQKCPKCGKEMKSGLNFHIDSAQCKEAAAKAALAAEAKTEEANAELAAGKENSGTPSEEDARRARLALKRTMREGMDMHKPSMTVAGKEGMHRHWFNDVGNNIHKRINQGYELVCEKGKVGERNEDLNHDLGSGMSLVTGTKVDGSPQISYCMEIEQELYDEDQDAKQREIDEVDKLIHAGKYKNELGEHGYVTPR